MAQTKEQIGEFSIKSIFELCRLQKRFLLIFIASAIIFTVVLTYFMPHEYEVTSSILPPEESESGGGLSSFLSTISGGISIGGMGQGNKVLLYTEIITSRENAKFVAEKCKLKKYLQFKSMKDEDLYELIRRMLDVNANRTGLIVINVALSSGWFPSGKDKAETAKLAAEIANAAIDGLNYINRGKNVSKARKKRIFISRMLDDNKHKLDSIDATLEVFQKANKVLAFDEQTQAILLNVSNIGTELAKAEIDLSLALQDMQPNSPVANAYRKKVNELRSQYSKTQSGGLVPTDEFSIPLNELPSLLRTYTNLMRDQKIIEQVMMYLETQKYQEAIQEESDIPTVEALDRAVPPENRSSPSRKIMFFLALFLSAFFGITYITIKAIIQGRVYLKREREI